MKIRFSTTAFTAWTFFLAAGAAIAAPPAPVKIVGKTTARITVNGLPFKPGTPLTELAAVSVVGGPLLLRIGEQTVAIKDKVEFRYVRGELKILSGMITYLDESGYAKTLETGGTLPIYKFAWNPANNPPVQIPALTTFDPPHSTPAQNLKFAPVSPSAP